MTALVVVFLLAVVPARASEPTELVLTGIDQLYDSDFDEAASSFDAAIAADPENPIGYFFRANVHLWSYLFDRRPEQLRYYMSMSDRAIKVAEARLGSADGDSEARLILGMTHGYRAIAHAREENFTAAALSARTCYERLEQLVRRDRAQYDAYLGLGLFHFAFGAIPKAAQVAAGLTGIKGDAALGMREIQLTASKGRYFKQDAKMVLALLTVYYKQDHENGLKILRSLADEHPRNVALQYSIGVAHLDIGNAAAAVPYFERVVQRNNADFSTFTELSYGRIGIAYFGLNEFSRAKGYLQKFIKNSNDRSMRAYAWYLLGVCYEMEGNRVNAEKSYKRAIESPWSPAPEDETARISAGKLLSQPLNSLDRQVIRLLNVARGSDASQAVKMGFEILVNRSATAEQKAQAYYAIGRGYMADGKLNDAIKAFNQAIELGGHHQKWVEPFSYYYMAESYRKLGNRSASQKNINKAKKYSNYANEVELRFLIERDVTLID